MLTWTGERYLPELEGNIALEHVHRYAMAREMAKGKRVLDIACGEGYGTAMLADVAEWAIGVDISREVIDHAKLAYPRNNLEFKAGSCAKIPIKTASVDLVVSFETIEHDDQHERMLSEIKRVLRPNGVLIISSPDKLEYSVRTAYANPFHVKELFRHEFEALMASHFKHVAVYGQRVIFGSGIFQEGKSSGVASFTKQAGAIHATKGVPRPLYLVALASDGPVPNVASSVFEQPVTESEAVQKWRGTVGERDGEIAALTKALASRDEQVAILNCQVSESRAQIDDLKTTIPSEEEITHLRTSASEGERRVAALQELIERREREIGEMSAAVSVRDEQISGLNQRVVEGGGRIADLNRLIREGEGRVTELERLVGARAEEAASLGQAASEGERRVASLQELVAQREREIGELSAAVSVRDEQISGLNQRVVDGGGRIAEMNRLIGEREGRVTELERMVAVRGDEATRLSQTVLEMAEEVGACRESMRAVERELMEARSRLTSIVSSNSWRITLPLREARRWVNWPRAQFERYKRTALKSFKRGEEGIAAVPGGSQGPNGTAPGRHAASVGGGQSPLQSITAAAGRPSGSAIVELGRDIVLATCDSPIVSVIVPTNGRPVETLRCLKAIHKRPPRLAFEVIVVSKGSVDNSRDALANVSGIRLVDDTEKDGSGYIQSCNAGARAAKGTYLMFLRNESELASDWMEGVERAVYGSPRADVRIAALTMVYNEAGILPYFLRHYRYLDEIHVLYETDSTDQSLEILTQARNVILQNGHIEGGLDDIEKIELFNRAIQRIKTDWVYVVDPDEFVFPPDDESPHHFLSRQSCGVVRSGMYQVYRHRNDGDLDPSLAPIPQRAHGDSDLFSTQREDHRAANSVYIKPNVVRPSKDIRFLPGHHQIEGEPLVSPELYIGAHWQMADPAIAIARRMERKARVSERNRNLKMGWQHFDVTIEKIKSECERHLDDPVIDALSSFREAGGQALLFTEASRSSSRTSMVARRGLSKPEDVVIGSRFREGKQMREFDPLEHPICLSLPQRVVPFLSWRQHVPFAMLLVDLLKPRTLVELGVHYGDSYCAFCQAVAELGLGTSCYGVDTWKGDAHASFYGPEVLAGLSAHHDPLYGGFSHLVQSTFDEAVEHFADGSIDILHIDGYHTYKAVKHDFETWLPKVSERGVILFHDIAERQRDFGVWKLWDQVRVRYPHFEFLHCHGLGLVAVGREPPAELRWLFDADDEKTAAIRRFFFSLGDRLTDKLVASVKREAPVANGADIEALQSARAELDAIRSSTTWRVARKLNTFADGMLPSGSRRREYARRALSRLKT